MPHDVVGISVDLTESGLYLTPDMWFYAYFGIADQLESPIQRILHDQQPLASSYAAFADYIYDHYLDSKSEGFYYGNILAALNALTETANHIERGLRSMLEVAFNIYNHVNHEPVHGNYPRVIPKEVAHLDLDKPWKIDRDVFRRLLAIDPWLSWTERLRAQYLRNKLCVQRGDMIYGLKHGFDEAKSNLVVPTPEQKRERLTKQYDAKMAARRSIKRAVKLHDRLFGLVDLRSFLAGDPLRIKGKMYNYTMMMRPGSLIEETIYRNTRVTPVHMYVYNKEGKQLASVCLYFEDTALLDHVANVKLYASNEETEWQMIRGFHIITATRAFFRDPVLPDLKGIHDPMMGPSHSIHNIMLYARKMPFGEIMYGSFYKKAQDALEEVLGFPKKYLAFLQLCSKDCVWNFTDLTPDGLAKLDSVGDIFD